MPRRAAFGKKKKTEDLVNKYGFSIGAIRGMQKMTPYLSMSKLVEGWAKHLLAAESDYERKWFVYGEGAPLMEEFYGQKIVLVKPKAMSYSIPGGRFTPDYLYIFKNGLRVSVEVKASQFQAGYRDAVARMRIASTLHWYDHFLMALWDKGSWKLDEFKPDADYITELQSLAMEVQVVQVIDTHLIAKSEGG